MKIQTNSSGTRSIEIKETHLQTIQKYQLLRDLIDSNGYVDEQVLDKLKLNIRSLLDSVGVKSGILLRIIKIMKTISNSHPNPYLQLKNVVMTPPKSGPIAAATAPITPTIAKATVRFSPEYVPLIMEMVAGSINAPAIPSITDHPINNIKALELIAAVNVPRP